MAPPIRLIDRSTPPRLATLVCIAFRIAAAAMLVACNAPAASEPREDMASSSTTPSVTDSAATLQRTTNQPQTSQPQTSQPPPSTATRTADHAVRPSQQERLGMREDRARKLIDRIRPKLSRKVADLKHAPDAAGHRIVDLQGRFHHALVVRAAPDGSLHYGCANSGEQAEHLLAPSPHAETAP